MIDGDNSSIDIREIKHNNIYINKSNSGLITWNIYYDNFNDNSKNNNGTIFHFINSTGNEQFFNFIGEKNIHIYDVSNIKLDIKNTIIINSTRTRILYTNHDSLNPEIYILNK